MSVHRPKPHATQSVCVRYCKQSSNVCLKPSLAPEILQKIVKSLSQYSSCARDITENRQQSIAVQVLRLRYCRKSSKVCRKTVLREDSFLKNYQLKIFI